MSKIQESRSQLKLLGTPDFLQELSALVRSRQPIIYVVTSEEKRFLEYMYYYSIAGGYRAYMWDCYSGLINLLSNQAVNVISANAVQDPAVVLDMVVKESNVEVDIRNENENENENDEVEDEKDRGNAKANIYILLDYHRFLNPCDPDIERRLRTIARISSNTIVIIVAPFYVATPALDKEMRVVDFPPPNLYEINQVLDGIVDAVGHKLTSLKNEVNNKREEITNSVKGLTLTEIKSAFSKTVCIHRSMDIPTILKEKQEVIRKTGILEFLKPNVTIDDVGGLGNLTAYLRSRKACFSESARNYGISIPKGILILGIPGTGKSMAAKVTASLYDMPLLSLNFGALFSSHVGDSERNVRQAIKIAEQLAPVVLWADEIDKGLAGVRSSGSTDSGVTARVVSTLLTWMQEKSAPVFMICTANDHENIPTEFMRAGRFDEVFFVDLPSLSERVSITEKLIQRKGRKPQMFDLLAIAKKSDGYTGAELEKAIDAALLAGFQDNLREINTDDILDAMDKIKPLSVMRKSYIEAMRVWATDRCVFANTSEVVSTFKHDSCIANINL